MAQGTLLPNLSEVKLVCLRPKDGAIQMELLPTLLRLPLVWQGVASRS